MYIYIPEVVTSWNWGYTDYGPEGFLPEFGEPLGLRFWIGEGEGFLKGSLMFDWPSSQTYDRTKCGVFADWLDDQRDNLLSQHPEEMRSVAEEKLDALCKWLRSGLQISA